MKVYFNEIIKEIFETNFHKTVNKFNVVCIIIMQFGASKTLTSIFYFVKIIVFKIIQKRNISKLA